ncbi:uncharacterized protein [Palaemon carinicauda]|uniref:uncharacterized protein isoform X1 n=1 Tax=Palaemon carinicauda TaxID=392227 RepID=UPI0035B62958
MRRHSGCRDCGRPPRLPSSGGPFLTLLTIALVSLLLLFNCAAAGGGGMERPLGMLGHPPSVMPSPPTTTTVPTCLHKEDLERLGRGPEVKTRRLYVNEKEEVLTMLSSSRVPQQLMTRIVAIFLKDWLGYVNLTITTVPNTFHPSSVVDAMTAPEGRNTSEVLPNTKIYTFQSVIAFITGQSMTSNNTNSASEQVVIPKAMANLEVWIPPGYNLDPLTSDFETSSYLGSGGRFGWFMPQTIHHDASVLDHWRAFVDPNSTALTLFSRTPGELKAMSDKMKDPSTGEYYCQEEFGCKEGMYIPERCENNECAVLFASYADLNITDFLKHQLGTMKAYVKVAWLGPNLNHEFIKSNTNLRNRSVLIFHWWPSVLLEPFNFTSVGFAPCIDSSYKSDGQWPYQCKYEMHRFHKFVWKKLKRYARFAYDALHKVQINHTEFMQLMKKYNDVRGFKTESTLDEVACQWIKMNQAHWDYWRPAVDKDILKLVGLFPINSSDESRNKFIAPGNVPAFSMAVKAVNDNDTILADYKIDQITLNGACEPAMVMRQFIEIIQTSSSEGFYNSMIGFVGPACSDTVEPVAGVSKYFNMPIISYGAEGAIFSDEDYPYFFRTIPENKIYRYVYNYFFLEMGWSRVASLNEDGQRYSEYLTLLQDLLNENNINLYIRKYPQERAERNMTQYLQDLKQKKYFIIIGDFYEDVARSVICDAYHMKMTGKQKYLWFLPHWFSAHWYDTDKLRDAQGSNMDSLKDPIVSCTTEEMRLALQGHMSLSYKYFAENSSIMQENKTVEEWRKEYSGIVRNLTNQSNSATESNYAGFTYDAVWTYALALDALFKDDQSYAADLRARNATNAYINKIKSVAFDGVSGPINFTSGSRVTDIILWQFKGNSYEEVGIFHPGLTKNDTGTLTINEEKLFWPSNEKPDDGSDKCDIEGFRKLLNVECRTAIIILCAVCFGGLATVLIACFVIFKRRYEKRLEQIQELWRGRPLFEIFDGWEIPRDKVVINRKIGEGAFGTVYGGECQFDTKGWVAVAVKTLKIGSTISEKLDFLSEADMMKNFEHENIVQLIGVCTKSEPIYTVMEFMLYADLKTYLLARRHLVNEKSRNDDDEVSNKRLTSMALDIARGLSYLAEMKYVHRDVASRNCLVNANRTVKLADFGMTRPMYENNYYKFNRKGMLPVRWMAPESLTEGVFTTMSDVWSYGVLLYEIVTFGAFPFQGMSNDQVLEHVKAGHTIAIPKGVKPQMEILLRSCWHHVPTRRIQILQIIDYLTTYPRLISPCLDGPQSSVQIEDTVSLELRIPDKTRKLSLSINNRLPQVVSNRKRSMSGNMVINAPLTSSLSEDGMISAHSNLDALNLNHVTLEENEMGEDPLLPPAQYVSSGYMSIPHKDLKEKESLVSRQQGDYCATDIPGDLWTNVTPV